MKDDKIDEVLEVFSNTPCEFAAGFSNHGPMGAEAMITLGREEEALPWAKKYRERLKGESAAPSAERITEQNWRSALGNKARIADWRACFSAETNEENWQAVLDKWVARLAPGMMAASTHGTIRTAHAVRSLSKAVTPLRLRELEEGLAYWAAAYLPLPTAQDGARQHLSIPEAILKVRQVPPEERPRPKLITDGPAALGDDFAAAINLIDTPADPAQMVAAITETFCHVYLSSTHDIGSGIGFIHSVTAPSAVRLLIPHLTPETNRIAVRFAWQSSAALYAAYGKAFAIHDATESSFDRDDLIDRAMSAVDEHAVKFTEACLREYAVNPRAVYLAAACHASNMLKAKTAEMIVC